jgi:hypothetical protein
VPLGPAHAVWNKLYASLADLARACSGAFAFVLDEGNGLWCVGLPGTPPTGGTRDQDRAADRFYRDEMVPRLKSLRRGAPIHLAKVDGDDRYVAQSFAGIYMLVVWFDGPLDPFLVRAKIREALPGIEALVVALPPQGGPGTDAGAVKMRA